MSITPGHDDPSSQPGMLDAIREFLAEKPEYIPDFMTKVIDGREEPVMSTDGVIGFTRWSIGKGYGNVEKSKRFLEYFLAHHAKKAKE